MAIHAALPIRVLLLAGWAWRFGGLLGWLLALALTLAGVRLRKTLICEDVAGLDGRVLRHANWQSEGRS
jgi:hypothetical protein